MKRFAGSLFVFLLLAITLKSHASEKPPRGTTLAFSFGKEPLVYSIHVKSENKTTISRGSSSSSSMYDYNGPSVVTKSATDVHYKIRLTGIGMTKDGLMSVKFEPFDYDSEADLIAASGHFISTMHGMSLKTTQNGIVVIDTDKDIGMAQAKTMKIDAILLMLSGEFDVNGIGDIKNIRGDLPFVDSRQEQIKIETGLFGFALPTHAVTNGETWEIVTPIKKFGGITIDGPGVNYTNSFTLEDDASVDDPNVAIITYSAPMSVRDLTGTLEEHGQSTHSDLNELKQRGYGKVHFDKKRHLCLDVQTSRSGSVVGTVLVEGRALTSRTESHVETELELVPASGEIPNHEKPVENAIGRKTL